jgi:hypothetical protein
MKGQKYTDDPSGDVQIAHAAFSGCSRPLGDPMTPEQAIHVLSTRASLYRKRGYPVTILDGTTEYPNAIEVSTPDDAGMIGDLEGIYTICPVRVPAWECDDCGELIPRGESCDCLTFSEPD